LGQIQCLRKAGGALNYDGIIIGGGPAGLYAAIHAARNGQKVLLLEQNDRLGKKLLITGKGRCNVTNHCSYEEVLQNIPRNGKFLFSAMQAHPPASVEAFFEAQGCPLKVERGNRVFPVSDRSQSVLTALQSAVKAAGVHVQTGKAIQIVAEDGCLTAIRTLTQTIPCRWAILATGGLSYPTTGSNGSGYRIAEALGHTVVPCEGSLVPLEIDGGDCQAMQGLSLRNVQVRLTNEKGKLLYKDFGELLFTHFGVSGPTVLSASAHLKGNCTLHIDLKPALEESKLDARILRDLDTYRNRIMENALIDLLPKSMIPVVLARLDIDPSMQANSFKKQDRHRLVALLKDFTLHIARKRPVAEAIITSGGIKTGEVNPKTMESKYISGLYFAGEILDCDAYTGGFNLQIAWATAYAAAIAASNRGNS